MLTTLTQQELDDGIILLHCPRCNATRRFKPEPNVKKYKSWHDFSRHSHPFKCQTCGSIVEFPKK